MPRTIYDVRYVRKFRRSSLGYNRLEDKIRTALVNAMTSEEYKGVSAGGTVIDEQFLSGRWDLDINRELNNQSIDQTLNDPRFLISIHPSEYAKLLTVMSHMRIIFPNEALQFHENREETWRTAKELGFPQPFIRSHFITYDDGTKYASAVSPGEVPLSLPNEEFRSMMEQYMARTMGSLPSNPD